MYHQIHHPSNPLRLQRFEQHLKALKEWAPLVVPGDQNTTNSLRLCLTFDDAYYDFYAEVWPRLQHYKIPAVLAVPVGFIPEHATRSAAERLQTPYPEGLATPAPTDVLCSWDELRQMQQQGLHIACHGYWHKAMNTTLSPEHFYTESAQAKEKLFKKLNVSVDSFMFPFGDWEKQWIAPLQEHFRYLFRIGHAMNQQWEQPMLHRIDADPYWLNGRLPTANDLLAWWAQGKWKRYRGR